MILTSTCLHRFASTVSDSEDEEGDDEEEDHMDMSVEPTHVDQQMQNHEPSKPKPTSSEQSAAPPSSADGKQPTSRNSIQALTCNGGSTDTYLWSQDKKEVTTLTHTGPLHAASISTGGSKPAMAPARS